MFGKLFGKPSAPTQQAAKPQVDPQDAMRKLQEQCDIM